MRRVSVSKSRLLIATVAIFSVFTLTISAASATPKKPTLEEINAAKKAEAAKKAAADAQARQLNQAKDSLRTLTAKANAAQAKYNIAVAELNKATQVANAAAAYAIEAAKAVDQAHRKIGKLAADAYIMGGSFSDIQPLLSSNGPQDLIDQLSTLGKIGASNSQALARFKEAEIVAKQAKEAADAAKAAQQVATDKVAAAKKIADDARAAQAQEVAKLQKVQDKLMADLIAARKVRTTLEQRRQLALLEEQNANVATTIIDQKKIWPDRGFKGRSTIRTTAEQRAVALAYAIKQVQAKKPYVWGAEGPNAFDCSGLVYAAYRAAGLGWPNWDRLNAALYSVSTYHVPLSQMQPGDLLFYSYNGSIAAIHHISIYAGNNMVWEARNKRVGLVKSNMYSMPGLMPFAGRP
ncbi:MAG: C40 family peptidase [Candidatus Nanopelagicaceae bacterium]